MAEDYEVQPGDCLNSIAFEQGFLWETLWNAPENAQLKQDRKDPNVLLEGDILHIPDLRIKEEAGMTETRHRFKAKGVPVRFRLRLLLNGQPMSNEPFELLVDGKTHQGETDQNGVLKVPLLPSARSALLVLGEGERQEKVEISFGCIDPIDTQSGLEGRLSNLGFTAEGDMPEAIRAFQTEYKLPQTGQADEATLKKLQEVFGE